MATSGIYDAIVVGGGPGGATAAFYLGEARRRVLVLEKETFPRYKACGGATSIRLLKEFPFTFDPVIESSIKAISYVYKDQAVTFPVPECPVRMTMRADLDDFLLSHARAEVHQGEAVVSVVEERERVIVSTKNGKQYEARYLVGADGPSSVVARSLGLRRKKTLLGAIEVEALVPQEVFDRYRDTSVFIFGEIGMGYLWIFSKAEHLSVGIGAFRPAPGELQSTLLRVMERCHIPMLGAKMHGHPVPIHIRREKIATARTLLVGDAAGLVDPMSGEGICYAIQSGRMAAKAIISSYINQYEAEVERQIGASLRANWSLARIIYRHPGPIFDLAVRNPFARQAFIDLYSERGGLTIFLLRLLGSVPPYLGKKAVEKIAGTLGRKALH
jgi:geranylgeranyl reductase family protein